MRKDNKSSFLCPLVVACSDCISIVDFVVTQSSSNKAKQQINVQKNQLKAKKEEEAISKWIEIE